ncbi:2-oxo-tetronate isomerase [Kushneria indalinina]|uniref:Hydroxypyruvate isomerase n=1 Tax=Kushneria indalinina DSM 14324 TaxID=1122140 RepID=A0A3D9DYM1_9GAMM|nr:2-oxo-tetronate isomerase [Kushneria indalinina]REC95765.1 hydroxypyruvate isomerase [Kushneria indalinina DSM 14324]
MPRFAANLTTMFNEVSFMQRFGEAAGQGFEAVEYLFPYAFDPDEIARELKRHDLKQVLFNLPAGDWDAGERGLAALPGRESEFRDSVETAIRYARALNCPRVHAMAGVAGEGADPAVMHDTYLDNIRFAARRLQEEGITLLLEPINSRDMPGYFINYQHEAHDVIETLGEPNVQVQMDFYHTQIMEGDIWETFREYREGVGHIQVAGVPERHEPDSGEVNYAWLFEQLDQAGFDGWLGCEYKPRGETAAGLGWFAPWRRG